MERSPRSADGSAGRRTRRTLATSTTAVALGASMFAGAGAAQADSSGEPLVVDSSLAVVDATVGQPITVDPATMDFKVRQAVLLAIPLAFDDADAASSRFAELDPISLDRAQQGSTFYSGSEIAEAAAPHLDEIGLREDKVEDVRWHFNNLVSGGNGVTVRGEQPAEPAEPAPAPDDGEEPAQQPPSQQPSEPPESTQPPEPSEPAEPPQPEPRPEPPQQPEPQQPEPAPPATAEPRSDAQLPAWARSDRQVTSIQPDMSTPPSAGALPDLGELLGRGGDAPPTSEPEVSQDDGPATDRPTADRGAAGGQDPASTQEDRQADARAAGRAEAVPTSASSPSITAPVALAAAALAVVSAGLVRTWVLRRQ
ncbi:hypothetical protein [Bounagaea algeriensis]